MDRMAGASASASSSLDLADCAARRYVSFQDRKGKFIEHRGGPTIRTPNRLVLILSDLRKWEKGERC